MPVELTPNGTHGARPRPRPLMRTFVIVTVVVFRVFGTRLRFMGRPLLLLTTVGAKSGRKRLTPLLWYPDTDSSWLITAHAGGSARHPAWYVNMATHPDRVWIEVGKRKVKVRPESVKGAEREETWRRLASLAPRLTTNLQAKTDREIPVIRLSVESGG